LYWRQGNHEVDFVLEYRSEIIGLEIKSARSRALSGMELFQRLFNPKKVLLVGASGIPWQEFLQIDPSLLFQ
jgi:predicted AAA+ superfamily ATPase